MPLIPAKAGTQIHLWRPQVILSSVPVGSEREVGFTWILAFAGRSGRWGYRLGRTGLPARITCRAFRANSTSSGVLRKLGVRRTWRSA